MNNPINLPLLRNALAHRRTIVDVNTRQTVCTVAEKMPDTYAAEIVRRVNGYPAALDALRELVIANHGLPMNPTDEPDPVCRVALEKARAVLAAHDRTAQPPITFTPAELETLTATAREEWREAVRNESTRLGFAAWCEHQAEIREDDPEVSETTLDARTLRAIVADQGGAK